MGTGSRTVTGVIRTHITVIGTNRPSRIKTAVGCLLAVVTLRPRARVSSVEKATASTAEIDTVTVDPIVAGIVVIEM
jgi:hypothetical protein